MSRHPPDLQANYSYRTLPEPHEPNGGFSTDPAGYISRNTDSNGWREHRKPFEELLPIKGENRPQYLDSPMLAPIRNPHLAQGSLRRSTPLEDGNSERSTRTTPHFRGVEESPPEHHAPTSHESREPRRSEGGGSGNPTNSQKQHGFSLSEQDDIIGYVKARMSWRQISQKMKRDQDTIKDHWNKVLKRHPRAANVHYDPDNRIQNN